MRRYSVAVIAVLVASGWGGCAVKPTIPPPPKLVEVVVEKTVEVPPELSQDCPITYLREAKERNVDALVKAHNANVLSLENCNRDKAKIRALPTTPNTQ